MMELINVDKEKCKLCYACVRACPVKAIKVSEQDNYTEIIHSRCISCGKCVDVCGHDAITYHSSIQSVYELLDKGYDVAALIDPTISGEFSDITDYRKFVGMIRKLGFKYAIEVAFGVDLVAAEYKKLFENFKGRYYISANCPAVVSYIEKYYPDMVDNLAPIVSPMIASAKVTRKRYGSEIKIVAIGPCVAAKSEAKLYLDDGHVDEVLTFTEIRRMFIDRQIMEKTLEFSDFDPPIGYKGSLYPLSNGILEAGNISRDLLNSKVITAEGEENMLDAVREFETYSDTIKSHFNLFYDFGCLVGPGTSKDRLKYLRRTLVMRYANKRLREFNPTIWEKNLTEFEGLDLSRTFRVDDQRLPIPPEEEVEQIMIALEKQCSKDEGGCAVCGYDSCHDFAVAVAQGLAKTDMCLSFSLKNRQEYIRNLKTSNDKLAEMQKALQESEKKARREQQLAREASETISSMLQRLPSSIVMVDKDLKVIQANRSFIEMMGEEAKQIDEVIPGLVNADLKSLLPYNITTIFSFVLNSGEDVLNRDIHFDDKLLNVSIFTIRKNKVIGAVLRDMYIPEVRREEVIKKVSEVIDKNLAMVQKIGFLLGEGAAETERMLNAIIESHKAPTKTKEE